MKLTINGKEHEYAGEEDRPLLWYLREDLKMTGTKFGCGVAACGACTVHVNGSAIRSCSTPASSMQGQKITTIEGLAPKEQPHQLQTAWIAHQVPQCGYCQSGMIMAAAALLARNPHPSDAEISAEVTNICRCGTYERVRRAIHSVAQGPSEGGAA
jgi:isoquinoline 1-oxidoreductase alpha subunit